MRLTFEWDPKKSEFNLRKHGVSFEEAMGAFADLLSLTILDPDHGGMEPRYLLLGLSYQGRLLVVTHVERSERIRVISARRADRREKRAYEEGED